MQVATQQAARALAALRSGRRRGASRRRRRARPARAVTPTMVDGALRCIETMPRVRRERVVAARIRLDAGERPSADEVADMIVRRAVCDRLR